MVLLTFFKRAYYLYVFHYVVLHIFTYTLVQIEHPISINKEGISGGPLDFYEGQPHHRISPIECLIWDL